MENRLKHYHWLGMTKQGRKQSGQMLACCQQQLKQQLAERHIQLRQVRERRCSPIAMARQRATHKDITQWTAQLATLLTTGISLVPALKLMQRTQTKAELKAIIFILLRELESGHAMSDALAKASGLFDLFYLQLIRNGELSGQLGQSLARIAQYREKVEQLKAKVVKALLYPTVVSVIALGVCYLMLTLVIPEFERMFTSFGASLPWFTRQVLELSNFASRYSIKVMLALVIIAVATHYYLKHSLKARVMLSRVSLSLPIVGELLTKAALAKFSRTLAISCQAGVPILSALSHAKATTDNLHLQNIIAQIHHQTSQGSAISVAMSEYRAFPELMQQMIAVGEESGQLDTMLNKIAVIYEIEVENRTDNLGQLFEPLIITVLGSIIGGLVIAMYLPIFNLMSVLG